MSEMIERVARAICIVAGRQPDQIHSPAIGVELPWWRIYEHQAVAAIEAMREPTEAMCHAEAEDTMGSRRPLGEYLDDYDAAGVWRGMIDEALK